MTQFITRVELHHASTYEDYNTLHTAMGKEGFARTVTGDDGKRYHLPTAEYWYVGAVSTADVLAKAKRAAATTRKTFGVIATESKNSAWEGLPIA
jgi:hypothetical protein